MSRALALCAAALLVSGECAAELPSRGVKPKPAQDKVRSCYIGGEKGIEAPGGTCIRIGGEISVGVGAGNVRH